MFPQLNYIFDLFIHLHIFDFHDLDILTDLGDLGLFQEEDFLILLHGLELGGEHL